MRYPPDRGNDPSKYSTRMEYTMYVAGRSKAARNNLKKNVIKNLFSIPGCLCALFLLVYPLVMRFLDPNGFSWNDASLFFGENKLFWLINLASLFLCLLFFLIDTIIYSTSHNRIQGINPRRNGSAVFCIFSAIFLAAFIFLCPAAQYQFYYLIIFYASIGLNIIGVIIEMSISEYGYEKR